MSRPVRSILVRRMSCWRLFEEINRGGQTILMVTHSVKAASHASRVLFIKDGEVFHEIYRGESSDEQLYQKISDTLTMLATAVSAMRNLYPRLAATNLKKNRRFYLPYLLACIVIVAMFCIILTLASDPYLGQMQHGGSVSQVLGFGVSIMALFSAIILFYTNSTFTKQRKREFAIYNILGMEKRHISYVLFWESLYTAAMALFFGLVAAGVFSKLLQLVLMRLIGGEATFGLNIRLMEHRLYGGVLRRAVFAAAAQYHPHHPSVEPRAAAARRQRGRA